MKRSVSFLVLVGMAMAIFAQQAVQVGKGSYASFTPLSISRTSEHWGDLSFQTDHRTLYMVDSLRSRAVPTNDYWTYALMNEWTGNLWVYPAMVRADASSVQISYPDHWSDDGCEMKWNTTLLLTAKDFRPKEALVADWSDFHVSLVLQDEDKEVRIILQEGSPLVWVECHNLEMEIQNPDEKKYAVFTTSVAGVNYVSVGLLTDGITKSVLEKYAFQIPQKTRIDYTYNESASTITTTFRVYTKDILQNVTLSNSGEVLAGFLPHHYKQTTMNFTPSLGEYGTPRGKLKVAKGNNFSVTYKVNGLLPFFPAPSETLAGYDKERMLQLAREYAAQGSFGADTYWGGKGLEQMAHYMTFAYQMGDMETFETAKSRLREALVNWFTYTPGEQNFFFARYQRFGAMVGYATSYDSDTFNDHHFHYGYYTYAAALLCLFDEDFKRDYGAMAREVALDYAGWQRSKPKNGNKYPWFRMLNPWTGHSCAGGMGNEGNGNGQESTSEAMQGWGGVWLLGAALGDREMMEAGIFGYTLERRATAEYWFDRDRENINYTLYQHPYCSNLTFQGVGWWTWFSGDPVWMHSIQWLPISPILTNYLSEDLAFTEWDYTQMHSKMEMQDYDSPNKTVTRENGETVTYNSLGSESGIGNVCLSYLSLFDPDSAAHVFDRMWNTNRPLAKNADTGGITYWLTHAHRTYGDRRYDLTANYPFATAYTKGDKTTYIVYNFDGAEKTVRYSDGKMVRAAANRLTIFTDEAQLAALQLDAPKVIEPSTTVEIPLHFLDQYGASFRADSTLVYTAPTTKGMTTITATYKGLSVSQQVRIGELPYIKEARIEPQIAYLPVGKSVTFRLAATDQYGEAYATAWEQTFQATVPCEQTVQTTFDNQEYKHTFTVVPAYPNIALKKPVRASSYENVGTVPQSATDGDRGTRWGSEHRDDEWIVVDLQSTCYIDYITVWWEAAYASRYTLEIASTEDFSDAVTFTAAGASAQAVTTRIEKNGRYIRLTGKERGTNYGTSLYELEAYGIDLSADMAELFGLVIFMDADVVNEGTSVAFEVKGYNLKGEELQVNPTLSVPTQNAKIDGKTLQLTEAGTVTLRAAVGNVVADKTILVQETEKLDSISITPERVSVPLGSPQQFVVQVYNQFGMLKARRSFYYVAEALGEFDVEGELKGMSAWAHVTVVPFEEVNLALHKEATCSGTENEAVMNANKAVDGDMESRWSSRFQDGEWIEVDLGYQYYINLVKIYWEASYATKYHILTSADGATYEEVYRIENGHGELDEIPLQETLARYVRVVCDKRVNQYGSSIYELQVFGTGMIVPENLDEEIWDKLVVVEAVEQFDMNAPIEVYTLLGQCVQRGMVDTLNNLPQGVYVLRQGQKVLKYVAR